MELPKLETFLKELQKSWKKAKILIKIAKEAIKKQFDKKSKDRSKETTYGWKPKNIQLK